MEHKTEWQRIVDLLASRGWRHEGQLDPIDVGTDSLHNFVPKFAPPYTNRNYAQPTIVVDITTLFWQHYDDAGELQKEDTGFESLAAYNGSKDSVVLTVIDKEERERYIEQDIALEKARNREGRDRLAEETLGKVFIHSYTGWNAEAAQLYVVGSSYMTAISIYGPEKDPFSGNLKSPKVNWPACGAQDTRTTRAFAKALLMACDMADSMQVKETEQK